MTVADVRPMRLLVVQRIANNNLAGLAAAFAATDRRARVERNGLRSALEQARPGERIMYHRGGELLLNIKPIWRNGQLAELCVWTRTVAPDGSASISSAGYQDITQKWDSWVSAIEAQILSLGLDPDMYDLVAIPPEWETKPEYA
jgi:hypothetical protein